MIAIGQAAKLWHLSDIRPIADTPGSLVYRARLPDGKSVVAKLLKPRGIGELAGMDYLAWRGGTGAANLLARHDNAGLLEDAGTRTLEDFRESEGEAAATRAFAGLLQQLQAPSLHPFPSGLVPLEQHFAALTGETVPMPTAHVANVAWAAATARDLLATQTNVMPLHGDLHHENILADDSGQWRAIDPHGLIGDPVYDTTNFFGNPLQRPDVTCDESRIRLMATTLAAAFACPEDKVFRYAAVHAALSACWSIEDPVSDDDLSDAGNRLTFLGIVRSMLGQ